MGGGASSAPIPCPWGHDSAYGGGPWPTKTTRKPHFTHATADQEQELEDGREEEGEFLSDEEVEDIRVPEHSVHFFKAEGTSICFAKPFQP